MISRGLTLLSLAFLYVRDGPADEGEVLPGVADGVGRAGVVQDARDGKEALQQVHNSHRPFCNR